MNNFLFTIGIIIFSAIVGTVVLQFAWSISIAEIFDIRTISFVEAFGLLLLTPRSYNFKNE